MNRKKKNLRRIIGGVSLIIFIYFAFSGDYNLYNLWKLNQKKYMLIKNIKQSELTFEQLTLEIKRLKFDTTYIEKVAREEFYMGKKGEKIYLIKAEDK